MAKKNSPSAAAEEESYLVAGVDEISNLELVKDIYEIQCLLEDQ